MSKNIYAARDHEVQGEHYLRHIDRMTVEKLHSKSAIAGELAHRDAEIAALTLDNAVLETLCTTYMSQETEIAALKSELARPESTEVSLMRSVHAAEIAALRHAIETMLPYVEKIEDAGPEGEGWQSDKLCKVIVDAEAALAQAVQ